MIEQSNHELFQAFPLTGEEEISVGKVPTPYHVYDGQGVLIGGTADLGNIRELLREEEVLPMQTADGQAVMGIWVVDFTAASLGPHNELQFSILVSHKPTKPIESHSLTLLKALFVNPDARMFSYKLWNNTETAVAYNRDLLGLNANLSEGSIRRAGGQKSFRFVGEAGELLCEGQVGEAGRTPPGTGWALSRLLGLRQTLRAFSQPYLEAKVVNPIGEIVPYNGDAQSYLASDAPVVQFFDPDVDALIFNKAYADAFKFQPRFIEHFAPFRFVYLQPVKVNDDTN